jgi:hypothetical protein
MMNRLNGIFERARKIEAALATSVEGAASRMTGAPVERSPLELTHAVVDAVARDIQPTGRGRYGFPYNQIRVTLLAPTSRVKAQLQAVVDGPESLAQRIEARLRAGDCKVTGVSVKVGFAAKARAGWTQPDFDIEAVRLDLATDPGPAADPRLDLMIVAGSTGQASYSFGASVVAIGRGTDICDSRGRLIRVNHVAFVDGDDDVNQTVSRLHARIERQPGSGSYRLFDDGSAQGSSVIRQGRGHVVSRGGRGMTLQAGDELVLGRARLRVKAVR